MSNEAEDKVIRASDTKTKVDLSCYVRAAACPARAVEGVAQRVDEAEDKVIRASDTKTKTVACHERAAACPARAVEGGHGVNRCALGTKAAHRK